MHVGCGFPDLISFIGRPRKQDISQKFYIHTSKRTVFSYQSPIFSQRLLQKFIDENYIITLNVYSVF